MMKRSGTYVIVKRPGVGPEIDPPALTAVFGFMDATSNRGRSTGACADRTATLPMTIANVSNTAVVVMRILSRASTRRNRDAPARRAGIAVASSQTPPVTKHPILLRIIRLLFGRRGLHPRNVLRVLH